MIIKWSYLGVVPYQPAMELMAQLRAEVEKGAPDHILLLQHDPVITRGSSQKKSSDAGLTRSPEEIQSQGIQIVDTDRGGQTTVHGPGQLVGYMIVDLKRKKMKLKDFVFQVMETVKATVDSYGLETRIDQNLPGLFVEQKKVAFCGFNVKQHVTTHGFSINVNNDLKPFGLIVPCGNEETSITSMEMETHRRHSIFDVYWRFITNYADISQEDMEETFIEDFG
jgi:lipoyl(octanoyl) transferase